MLRNRIITVVLLVACLVPVRYGTCDESRRVMFTHPYSQGRDAAVEHYDPEIASAGGFALGIALPIAGPLLLSLTLDKIPVTVPEKYLKTVPEKERAGFRAGYVSHVREARSESLMKWGMHGSTVTITVGVMVYLLASSFASQIPGTT